MRPDKEPFDEENTGWGWKLIAQDRRRKDTDAADHLQDEPAGLSSSVTLRARGEAGRLHRPVARPSCFVGRSPMLELIIISTLNGVLFGMLLFLMASGLTLIFSMMGVLNFAHASFYMLGAFFGFQISRCVGFWPGLVLAPLLVGRDRRAGRALRPAQRAPPRPRGRAALHLRARLRDRGAGADDLGQGPGRLPCAGRARLHRLHALRRPTTRPTSCSCC